MVGGQRLRLRVLATRQLLLARRRHRHPFPRLVRRLHELRRDGLISLLLPMRHPSVAGCGVCCAVEPRAVEPLRGEALLDHVRRGMSVRHHVEYAATRGRKWSDNAQNVGRNADFLPS